MRHFLHIVWRVLKPLLEVAVAVVVVLLLVVVPTLAGSTGTIENNLKSFVVPAATTTGPLTGDQSVFNKETSCIQSYAKDPANNYLGYYPAIGSPEHTDNVRTGVMPCATFTGDLSGQNQVFQYASESNFGDIQFVVFDGPNGAYLQGGGLKPPGQYVSKFDPSTGKEIWRTYLTNVNLSGQWIAFGSMAVVKDGSIVNAAGHTFWKLDPNTGAILAAEEQPILGSPGIDANFDGMMVAPDSQGTLLIKTQNRSVGCPTQGNFAISTCVDDYGDSPNTTVVAVDPVTMKNIDALELDQNVVARGVATEHDGTIYIYMNAAETLVRVIWDPVTQELTQDKSWAPKVLLEGQTAGASPTVLGDWVIANTNASSSDTTPQCVFAANQDDPNDVHSICPWGETFPTDSGATSSAVLASPAVDPANSLILAMDYLAKGVYAIHIDQQTGEMQVVWSRPDWWTSDYFSMVGPADQRVLMSQNISADTPTPALLSASHSYTESLLWVDEATGKTIAESADNASTALGSLPNVGYGGRVYMMGNAGTVFIYQVQACKDATINVTPPSTTACPTVTASTDTTDTTTTDTTTTGG